VYLPDFDYYAPDSVKGVSQMLLEREGSVILSGGTDLLTKMKNGLPVTGLAAPKALISLTNVPSRKTIEYVPGRGVVIGGAATCNDVASSEVLHERYNSVCGAAASMAANQVRNAGTIAGNIVAAVPSADLPPILIVLNATVKLESAQSERLLPIEEVFAGPGRTVLERGEVLTEVIIPDQAMTGSAYFKYALRKAGALAIVGVAVAVRMEGNVIKDIRVAFGAVAPVPMRAPKVEAFLKGKEASEANLEAAADIAREECKPITDQRASEEYRRDMVGVFTKRAIQKAIAQGHN
jgi:carbon-monoxide dehydrogenase medium subunit